MESKSVKETLLTRRSIRRFEREAITAEQLDLIYEAIRNTPTSYNGQQFTVIDIDDQELKEKLYEIIGQKQIKTCNRFMAFCIDYNRIIGKYRGLCENGRIFPVPHYNTCLAGIRAVAKRCGITKHITWHQSRHTAATTVFLSNGVPIETVSSMLGHKSIKTTQIYAKITKEKLNQDMENLAARLNSVEEFAGCTI